MKRQPRGWAEQLARSLEAHPSPALQDWRWAREGEEPVDPRAVETAWDLVTLQASAEAAKLHHAMTLLSSESARTLLPALVASAVRFAPVGAVQVEAVDGSAWHPQDLAFVPGRERLDPDLTIRCGAEIARSHIDFLIGYRHRGYSGPTDALREVEMSRGMAVLLDDIELDPRASRERHLRDMELQHEGLLVVRLGRAEIWRDPMEAAYEALRTLVDSTRFEAESAAAAADAAGKVSDRRTDL